MGRVWGRRGVGFGGGGAWGKGGKWGRWGMEKVRSTGGGKRSRWEVGDLRVGVRDGKGRGGERLGGGRWWGGGGEVVVR